MGNYVMILLILSWLYALQGIPYGIQDKFIPMHVYMQSLTFANVSLMKFLFLPWVCKGIWAPFIQVYLGPSFWLIASIIGLGILCSIGSFLTSTHSFGIAIILFILNLLSAVQDIVVDGLALNSLPDSYIGFANSIQVVMYKIGSLFGGAGMIYMTNYTSWRTSFLFISSLYFITTPIVICSRHLHCIRHGRKVKDTNDSSMVSKKPESFLSGNKHSFHTKKSNFPQNDSKITKVFDIFKEVLNTRGMPTLILYVIIYKMGERGALNNFPLYLLRQGVSTNDLAFWNGMISQGFSILGSVIGGWKLMSSDKKPHKNRSNLLKNSILKRSLCIFIFYITVTSEMSFYYNNTEEKQVHVILNVLVYYISVLSLVYLNYISGVISTLTFSHMMTQSRALSNKEAQSAHYSCLASLEVAGKLCFAASAGFIIDFFGVGFSFGFFCFLSILPYFIVL